MFTCLLVYLFTLSINPLQAAQTASARIGINGAAAKVAAVLQSKGFIITGVETGKRSDRANTIIVTDSSNVNWFYGMPFECIIMDGGQPRQAIVYIGRDYND